MTATDAIDLLGAYAAESELLRAMEGRDPDSVEYAELGTELKSTRSLIEYLEAEQADYCLTCGGQLGTELKSTRSLIEYLEGENCVLCEVREAITRD